jgi:hypothetical protein
MLVLKQRRKGCCIYLHIQNWNSPEFRAVLSPHTTNEAYLYWRLATATTLMDVLERDLLEYPEFLLLLEFQGQTVAESSSQSSSYGYLASDVMNAIKGVISSSKDQSRDRKSGVGLGKKTTSGTMGAIRHEESLSSWNVEFSSFNDASMEDTSGESKSLPIATLRVMNVENKSIRQLVSRPSS